MPAPRRVRSRRRTRRAGRRRRYRHQRHGASEPRRGGAPGARGSLPRQVRIAAELNGRVAAQRRLGICFFWGG